MKVLKIMEMIQAIRRQYKLIAIGTGLIVFYIILTINFNVNRDKIIFLREFASAAKTNKVKNGTKAQDIEKLKIILNSKSLTLEDIMTIKNEPKRDEKNIFFIEAFHVLEDPPNSIGTRQACSYESAGID